jgi:hypothetical protein
MTNANTFYTGVTGSLDAGTWFVVGSINYSRSSATATSYTSRLGDGTNHYAAAQTTQPSLNPHTLAHTLSAVIVLDSTTVIQVQGAANQTGCTIRATPTINGTGLTNLATNIRAVRLK